MTEKHVFARECPLAADTSIVQEPSPLSALTETSDGGLQMVVYLQSQVPLASDVVTKRDGSFSIRDSLTQTCSICVSASANPSETKKRFPLFDRSKCASAICYWQRASTNPNESRDNVDTGCSSSSSASSFHSSMASKCVDSYQLAPYGDFLLQLPTFQLNSGFSF